MIIRTYQIKSGGPRLRIVVAADFHNRDLHADIVGERHPDLILVPGDLCYHQVIRENCHPDEYYVPEWDKFIAEHPEQKPNPVNAHAKRFLSELATIAPTYMSIGNHECLWKKIDRETAERTGAVLLDNTYTFFREQNGVPVYIGGLSSVGNQADKKINAEWLKEFSSVKGYRILMMHEPQLFPGYIADTPIDLTVSGHAHGGQWRFFGHGIFAPNQGLFPKYTRGLYFNSRLAVSAGMTNTAGIPRFFNPCELVVIDLSPDYNG